MKPAAVHGYGAEVQREKWVRVVGTWVCKIAVSWYRGVTSGHIATYGKALCILVQIVFPTNQSFTAKIIVSILGRKFNLVQFALEANQRRAKKEGQNTPSQANSY